MKTAFARIERSLQNLLARAVVTGLNTAKKCQMLQVELMPGEPKEDVEHLEPYGFTSAPLMGAEGVALFPDGDRSHGVILVIADRRYRIKGLQAGEVAIYTDEGDSLIFKRGNVTELTTKVFNVNATDSVNIKTQNYNVIADTAAAITAPAIGLNGNLKVSDVSGGTAGTAQILGSVKIGGDQEVVGISKARDHLSGIISGLTHAHDGVDPGDGNSGGPI
ncbi:phage baseplate assembly protein V [Enterobacter kobei]|uniref:phage baseplate assembly protein V n=1 Tax=Enterobacter kobei TaxID=208224 RepID=UPI000792B97E|nr:phage baseplate assembly protein V [Enterobacter kobei]SAF46733.1 phage baseplate assembly protein V [Enterobacter kobei]